MTHQVVLRIAYTLYSQNASEEEETMNSIDQTQ